MSKPKQIHDDVRRARIEEYLPMARRIARSIARTVPSSVRREDLESAAYLGLTEAASRYQASRSETFCAYAAQRIRGAVLDELRRCDLMPRRCREKAKRLERAVRAAEQSGPATTEKVAGVLGMSVSDLHEHRYRFHAPTITAFDHIRELASPEVGVEAKIERRQRAAAVRRALAELDERDRTILHQYYAKSRSQKEIGAELGVTESRVCQLRKRAEETLRRMVVA